MAPQKQTMEFCRHLVFVGGHFSLSTHLERADLFPRAKRSVSLYGVVSPEPGIANVILKLLSLKTTNKAQGSSRSTFLPTQERILGVCFLERCGQFETTSDTFQADYPRRRMSNLMAVKSAKIKEGKMD